MSVVENAEEQVPSSGFHAPGLVWKPVRETGNLLVGDSVDLVLDVPAARVA
jgi:hypothetical protein